MDGKKKKNRKKKGNQNKVTDDAAHNAEEAAVPEPHHGSAPEQNHHEQVPGNTDVQSVGVSESDKEPESQKIYEARCEEVRQLEDEKSLWLQKVACLEEKIRFLQNEVESCVQKEAILEEKLKDLQIENDSSMQKQVILKDKVKHIEGIEDTWNLKEMWIKEMITRLDEVNVGLQSQVTELKESTDNLLQDNQRLKESLPLLELRIQRLEREASFYGSSTVKITEQFPEENNLVYQMEAAHEPMNKLEAENAVLEKVAHELPDEKVNKVHIEPDQRVVDVEPSTAELDHATSTDYASEYGEMIQPSERIHHGTEDFGADPRLGQGQTREIDESRMSEDVVSVPLDDIQVQLADLQAMKSDQNPAVPISDAPLIGAPFRLISYVAKYVSGADLVNQNIPKSG